MPLPPLLDSRPEDCLINAGQPDQRIQHGSGPEVCPNLMPNSRATRSTRAMPTAPPVLGPDDDEYCGQEHRDFSCFSSPTPGDGTCRPYLGVWIMMKITLL